MTKKSGSLNLDIPGDKPELGEKCHPKRIKEVQTVLGTIRLNRFCFYRAAVGEELQGQGRFPLDDALGLINGYSPGMAKHWAASLLNKPPMMRDVRCAIQTRRLAFRALPAPARIGCVTGK